ncbi:cytochrome P450 71A8-like [Salvia splendens]|uniref:cytochrome P450 71A8-like n=1 Tax=Salvia splendens TaxID=180675 RepID=UPI001C26CA1C|nr:cytochrome P450 71A8-like [Salvia splendens]
MEEIGLNFNPIFIIFTSLVSLILLFSINRILFKSSPKRKLPPSPPKLPIIGNLHQLASSLPHHALHSMAQQHGPIMLLHFGSVPTVIVSSADIVREIIRSHDLNFSNRPELKAMRKLLYGSRDVGSAPHGEYWRQMRSIFVLQMLSSKRVQSFGSIREEETALMVKRIEESSGPVDLSKMMAETNADAAFRSTFGGKYSETENGKKFPGLMREFMDLIGTADIGDFVPWLGWIGRVNGFDKRLDETAKRMDEVLESVIQERQAQVKAVKEDFVDVLVEIYKDRSVDSSIDRDSIKALLLDVFVGGTDTISSSTEWVMSELLRHPRVMEKLQSEVRGIVKQNQHIKQDDLEKMGYMKAVIKETLRLHPPFTLVSRMTNKDVQIKGYDVAAGTLMMINVWALGRDHVSWVEPEKFRPERFLNSLIDFKGQDFELIPFGAGRRGCPGITYATVTMEIMLANLVHKFDWKLPNGIDLDMTESHGVTAHRASPLLALASQPK